MTEVKWLQIRSPILIGAYVYIGIFVVLASAVWFAHLHTVTEFSVTVINWYVALSTLPLAVLAATLLLRHTMYQRLIPRVHLVVSFLVWITLLVATVQVSDLTTLYVLLLLEAPVLFLLLALVAHRIRQAFAPQTPGRWLTALTLVLASLVVVLAPTNLNYELLVSAGTVTLTAGVGYAVMVGAGFVLLFASLCYIPLGRPRATVGKTYSVGPLVFSPPADAQDANLIHLVEHVISEERRHLLKRGQWLFYRNRLTHGTGVVITEPASLQQLLTTLISYAGHQNQSRSIAVQLFNDPRHEYLHLTVEYTVNTHRRAAFTTYAEHAVALGGALTVERTGRTTRLVLTFPLQW